MISKAKKQEIMKEYARFEGVFRGKERAIYV